MLEDIARAVDAGGLAIPDAENAISLGAGMEVDLLRSPNRGGRKIFVQARLKADAMRVEQRLGLDQPLIITTKR